jgi:nucleotide-binding universal stress UspA family protein
MTRYLLLPWAASDDLGQALELPAPLRHWARQTDTHCVLLHVLPRSLLSASPAERARARRDARESLEHRQAELTSQGLGVTIMVRIGDPAEEIEKEAILLPAFAIAMPTHAREGLGRLLSGSVAESVLRHSDIPQLLWNGRGAERGTSGKRTVLLPVADMGSADGLLPAITEYARATGATVVVFHEERGRNDLGEDLEPAGNQAYVNELCARLKEAGVGLQRLSRPGGPVAEEILAVAEECKAELIALETHGRSGVDRLIFGSVAETVVRRAPCAVWLQHIEPIGTRPQEEPYFD